MNSLVAIVVLLLAPLISLAGDYPEINVAYPVPPTLAVVMPGVQVVVDHDEEVFYTNHHYWLRREGHWYRAMHHDDAFTYVEDRHVPAAIAALPPGRYRHHHPVSDAAHHGYGQGHDYGHDGHGAGHGEWHGDGQGCGH